MASECDVNTKLNNIFEEVKRTKIFIYVSTLFILVNTNKPDFKEQLFISKIIQIVIGNHWKFSTLHLIILHF